MTTRLEGTFKGWFPNQNFGLIDVSDDLGDVKLFKEDAAAYLPEMGSGTRLAFSAQPTKNSRKATLVEVLALVPIEKPRRGKIKFWDDEKDYGYITPYDNTPDVYIHVDDLPKDDFLSDGLEVEFRTNTAKKRPQAYEIKIIKWIGGSDNPLTSFADMGKSKDWLDQLAEMAEDKRELWEYKFIKTAKKSFMPILRSYFRFTFQRLLETGGICYSSDDKYASFNTGLVTEAQDEIFALFTRHNKEQRQEWKFSKFHKISDRSFVAHFGASPPPLADYFDDPSVLLFDRRLQINIDYEHVMENLERFPTDELRNNAFLARQLLESAVIKTKARVYRNYKAAIPQYFRDKGKKGSVQLLLPICLLNPTKADIALVAERVGRKAERVGEKSDESYICRTILTLDMAYNNARLLTRPDNEWLQP